MLFKKNQNVRPTVPHAPDGSRQEIAAHLRAADKSIREGKLEEAKEELDAVRALEPNNVYALALEERRQALENAAKEKSAEKKGLNQLRKQYQKKPSWRSSKCRRRSSHKSMKNP